MKGTLFFALIFFLFIGFLAAVTADTVITHEGDQYHGKVIYQDEDHVILEMRIGTLKLDTEEVASIEKGPRPVYHGKAIADEEVEIDLKLDDPRAQRSVLRRWILTEEHLRMRKEYLEKRKNPGHD